MCWTSARQNSLLAVNACLLAHIAATRKQVCIAHCFCRCRVCPVAFRLPFLCIFTNLEVGLQERYLPIIRGAWTPSPCVPSHFNHCPQGFYPRDAMLTRVLAGTLCPSVCVCLAVTSRCSIEICGRLELVFGTQASFDLSYTVLQGTSGI